MVREVTQEARIIETRAKGEMGNAHPDGVGRGWSLGRVSYAAVTSGGGGTSGRLAVPSATEGFWSC